MSFPKISVAIATYNGALYIKEQLTSILRQVDNNAEIIISDDGSTDATNEIIKSFNDQRIRLIRNAGKKGVIRNFENALNNTTGDIIFLSDQDDVWLDNKVKTMKEYLQEYDLVVSDCTITDQSLNTIYASYFQQINAGRGLIKNLLKNTYHGCTMAFKKEVLKVALPFPENIPMHDNWIGFTAELFFNPHFIPDKLLLHRRHSDNTSTASEKSKYNFFQKLKFRIDLLRYLPLLLKRRFLLK